MRERPILFTGEMVRAILDGRKTQTRRLFKVRQNKEGDYLLRSPYGEVGDRLWVRESFCRCVRASTGEVIICYRAEYDDHLSNFYGKWTPSIFMPRAMSRILLEITNIRVEKLQDISEEDAKAEGVTAIDDERGIAIPSLEYMRLWESINGAGSWADNPWVYVITFKRVGEI